MVRWTGDSSRAHKLSKARLETHGYKVEWHRYGMPPQSAPRIDDIAAFTRARAGALIRFIPSTACSVAQRGGDFLPVAARRAADRLHDADVRRLRLGISSPALFDARRPEWQSRLRDDDWSRKQS